MDTDGFCPLPAAPRLLLVEREAAMRTLLTQMLTAHYEVEAVRDALTAFQTAKTHPPALVLVDLYHPGTDNLTLIRSLRAGSGTAMVPVLLLTASVNSELLLRCLTAGANDFLLKPFGLAELLTCVRQGLQVPPETSETPKSATSSLAPVHSFARKVHAIS